MQMMTDWSISLNQVHAALGDRQVAEYLARWDTGWEASGIIVRIPSLEIGSVSLKEVGALGVESIFGEGYSRRTAVPVVGWLGGNVLKGFRLTIDFAHRVTYWRKEADLDPHDLDQVGLTLLALGDKYFIAGISSADGHPTVAGVQRGDQLIEVNGLKVTGASREAVLSALHGKVGDIRSIVVSRHGQELTVQAEVTRF